MGRSVVTTLVAFVCVTASATLWAADIRGVYLETRTCQVYTGPCFANSEMGLAGREAIMAWHIDRGHHKGVELSNLNVVVVLRASHTLGFQGLEDAASLRAVVLLDERATPAEREALLDFARTHAGKAGQHVVRVDAVPIAMDLDLATLDGQLTAGSEATLVTRKARRTDCICSHEEAFYPPLAQVEQSVAGITTQGEFRGKGLGSRWSTPDSRSAFMATFAYES